MIIAVCVKQVVDTTFPFDLDPDSHHPLAEDTFYVLNPADAVATEVALRIKDERGAEVVFVSVGPLRVEQALRACLAMGGDRAVHIVTDGCPSSPTAYALAEALRKTSPDLVLCGSQSADENCSEVPPALAELLALPQVTGVVGVELSSDGKTATLERKLERGLRQRVQCPLPALLAVENGAVAPRYPSFPRLRAALRANIVRIPASELGLVDSYAGLERHVVGASLPRPRPKKTFAVQAVSAATALSADERLKLLLLGAKSQKSGQDAGPWQGTPEELARRLARLIKEQGFLRSRP